MFVKPNYSSDKSMYLITSPKTNFGVLNKKPNMLLDRLSSTPKHNLLPFIVSGANDSIYSIKYHICFCSNFPRNYNIFNSIILFDSKYPEHVNCNNNQNTQALQHSIS